jgi:UDP-N-acetylmuramate dehydrogenase
MRDAPVDRALLELGDIGTREVVLAPMTTYRVGGRAAVFARPTRFEHLDRIAAAQHRSGLPITVIGRGSNLLVAESGYRGIVVSAAAMTDDLEIDDRSAVVRAGSAVALPVLARKTAAHGLTGFEWAVGVPGSLGGAVRMNAGGHGSDMAERLVAATVVDLGGPTPCVARVVSNEEIGLCFRGSALGPNELVIDATIELEPGDRSRSEHEIADIVAWRRAHQPGGQNAGSVFVNPVPGEVSAGALIDAAGLRGLRFGSAQVSDKHANFIQADEGGSSDDVYALMQMVRERVAADTGYRMRTEIRLLGYESWD